VNTLDLSAAGRIDALVAVHRHRCWLEALELQILAGLEDQPLECIPGHPDALADFMETRDQVACALRISPDTATRRLKEARGITARAPHTLDLLAQGRVPYPHARNMAELTAHLDEDTAAQVEDLVLAKLPDQTVAAARKAIERAVLKADPHGATQRHTRAREDRRVTLQEHPDGMAWWGALLPAEDALRVDTAVDTHARTYPADGRTLAQKRADALVDLTTHHPQHTHQHEGGEAVKKIATGSRSGRGRGDSRGRGVQEIATGSRSGYLVEVKVGLDTLLGLDDEPADLTGYGPITAHHARQLAARPGTLYRRLLTDPASGRVVKVDPTRYRPTADTHRLVVARDRHCRFPGCPRPAHRCDLDHVQPYRHGGPTTPENLIALCRRHHLTKHRAGWTVTHNPTTGTVTWTAPTGHTYHDN
jgi:hypothetical protein